MPVAWWTALATAAGEPTMPISPIPLEPIGLTYGSSSSIQLTSISPTSGWLDVVLGESWFTTCPTVHLPCSPRAAPIPRPIVIPPINCERAVLGLMMFPTAKTPPYAARSPLRVLVHARFDQVSPECVHR